MNEVVDRIKENHNITRKEERELINFINAFDLEQKRKAAEGKPRQKVVVPMPRLTPNPNAGKGPLIVTDEYRNAWHEKNIKEKHKRREDLKPKMIKIMSEIAVLEERKSLLHPKQKKYSEKMADYSFKIKHLKDKLEHYERVAGTKIEDLDDNSQFMKFWKMIKRNAHRIGKKIKKFFKKYKDAIEGVLSLVIPVIGGLFLKKIIKV